VTDEHKANIWQRGDARKIMEEERKRFKNVWQFDAENEGHRPVSAYVSLASTHYSLVKRYLSPAPIWMRPLAVWHMWRAAVHAKSADKLTLNTPEQIDVVSRILMKAPRFLGGNLKRAHKLVTSALDYVPVSEPQDEILPHTRALMLCTLGELEFALGGDFSEASQHMIDALKLADEMMKESDELQAKRQFIRVQKSVGLFFADNGETAQIRRKGRDYLTDAYWLADETAAVDQREEIDELINQRIR
jgi:hypothetical protein